MKGRRTALARARIGLCCDTQFNRFADTNRIAYLARLARKRPNDVLAAIVADMPSVSRN